jgi:hypothetical protein
VNPKESKKTFEEWWTQYRLVPSPYTYKEVASDAWAARQLEVDALSARLKTIEAEKEQWEPEWRSQAEANAAGYNEAHARIRELQTQIEFCRLSMKSTPKGYPQLPGDRMITVEESLMDKQFKVGDEVRVYTVDHTYISGFVEDVNHCGHVRVSGHDRYFHPKQCRRLVKKKRREWWVRFCRDHLTTMWTEENSPMKLCQDCEVVRVREVKK